MSDDPIKDALRMIPYGFYAITTNTEDDENIMVANWLTQASMEPRMLVLGLATNAYSYGLVEESGVFTVNIFSEENADILKQFTKGRAKDPDKVEKAEFERAPETGCPVLEGASAYIECRVKEIVETGGDHNVVIADVINADVRERHEPEKTLSLPDLGWSYAG